MTYPNKVGHTSSTSDSRRIHLQLKLRILRNCAFSGSHVHPTFKCAIVSETRPSIPLPRDRLETMYILHTVYCCGEVVCSNICTSMQCSVHRYIVGMYLWCRHYSTTSWKCLKGFPNQLKPQLHIVSDVSHWQKFMRALPCQTFKHCSHEGFLTILFLFNNSSWRGLGVSLDTIAMQ